MKVLYKKWRDGQLSVSVLFFATLTIVLITGAVFLVSSNLNSSVRIRARDQTFAIAEAGIEYYRWRLAHDPTDYWDGNGSTSTGPYTHAYYNKDGDRVGEFELEIIAPESGSSVITIKSTGKIDSFSSIKRVIKVRMAVASLAKYALITDDNLHVSAGTEIHGEVHANGGIHFDGLGYNIVSGAQLDYNDPDHSGGNEFGVHTHTAPVDPLPPTSTPQRSDVFKAGRQFPVPAVDFDSISPDLAQMKTDAQADGLYFTHITASGKKGWHIVFKTDGTVDAYQVKKLKKGDSGPLKDCAVEDKNRRTWTIESEDFDANYAFPNNGIIFVEDNVWVHGQIDGARLTLGSAFFPAQQSKNTSIIINNDLTYTNYDGSDVLGLVAQEHVTIGLESEDDLKIDAALVAQAGRVGRFQYEPACDPYDARDTITLLGMIATRDSHVFSYNDGTGYQTRDINYDSNLLYNPPPGFPVVGNDYVQLSWEEVQ